MAIFIDHVPWFSELFSVPGVVEEPMLLFGQQDIRISPIEFKKPGQVRGREKIKVLRHHLRRRLDAARGRIHPDLDVPEEYLAPNLTTMMRNRGLKQIEVLDLFDPNATLRYDMNLPVPEEEHEKYRSFIDIGCIEHLFDTWTCLKNCLQMVSVGGHYTLHTPVHGYFAHGLHVFNPAGICSALEINGFELTYLRFSSQPGVPLPTANGASDVIMWLVAKKLEHRTQLTPPQQGYWNDFYKAPDLKSAAKIQVAHWEAAVQEGRPPKN
jgi:hypothetical protein